MEQITASDVLGWKSLDDIASAFEKRGLKQRPKLGADNEVVLELADDEFIALVEAGPGESVSDHEPKNARRRHTNLVVDRKYSEFTFITRMRAFGRHAGQFKHQRLSFSKPRLISERGQLDVILTKLNSIEYGSSTAIYSDLYDTRQSIRNFHGEVEALEEELVEEVYGVPNHHRDVEQRYVGVILDRMIFLHYLQEKRLADRNIDPLRERHSEVVASGDDVYETLYEPLFFGEDGQDFQFGKLSDLDFGLFRRSPVEEEFDSVTLGDTTAKTNELFGRILDFLSEWNWDVEKQRDIIDPKNLSLLSNGRYGENLEISPENTTARVYYALFLWEVCRAFEKAADHFETALELDPESVTAHINYATLVWREFDAHEEATDHLETALELDPESPRGHANYALLLSLEFDACEEAADHFETALELDPEYAKGHADYAILLWKEFDACEEAADHFETALELDHQYVKARSNYGVFVSEAFDAHEEAADHLETALELNPKYAKGHANYARLLWEEFDACQKAADHFEAALELNPEYTNGHANYAFFLWKEFDACEEAADHFETALELDPEYAVGHANYAFFLWEEFDACEEAADHFETAFDLNLDSPRAHLNYARLLWKEFDACEEAADHFEAALELDPESPRGHADYALLLSHGLDAYEEAADHFEAALELDPASLTAHVNYALLLWEELDAYEKAADHFEAALELDPDSAQIHFWQGGLLAAKLDAPERASNRFETAQELGIENKYYDSGEISEDQAKYLYLWGLTNLARNRPERASELLTKVWNLQEVLDEKYLSTAAGVWCLWLPETDTDSDLVKEVATTECLSRSPVVEDLADRIFEEGAFPEVTELDGHPPFDIETHAYRTLVSAGRRQA